VARAVVQPRLDGLSDEPRPGAQQTISDEQIEDVTIRTLETTPRRCHALEYVRHGQSRRPGVQTRARCD
jgi:hypothetical protein